MEILERKTCRLCNDSRLKDILSLGEQYISNFVLKEEVYNGMKAPLELVMCENCSLLQLKHTAPQELLYRRFYWYRSGVTNTMQDALNDIVKEIETVVELKTGDVILDIEANDGTLLKMYRNKDLIKVGCEPADNLIE